MQKFDKYIKKIIDFSGQNPSLIKSHHFLYNLPLPGADPNQIEFVIMGINPGETNDDWALISKPMQEETHGRDFHVDYGGRSGSSLRWHTLAASICGTKNLVQTEAFFWSSKKIDQEHFTSRFGFSFDSEECKAILNFCKCLNLHLLHHYKPKAVIAPGLKLLDVLPDIYSLTPICVKKCPITGHRLIEKYIDKNNTPWLFTKHWSGARGFTNAQKKIISDYIKAFK